MTEPIEESYFNWLCAKVLSNSSNMYRDLLHILHSTEFVWVVPIDENRLEDGLELRIDFLRETRLERDDHWYSLGCSVLEMLIAFSRRAEFQTGIKDSDWFWELIENLGLGEFRRLPNDPSVISEIIDRFIWRTYSEDGHGGLFPLRWPKQDQRELEIWYQFYEYLEDQGRL